MDHRARLEKAIDDAIDDMCDTQSCLDIFDCALKAKDEEIERLKERRRRQSDYNIQLQRLLESLQYEETPYPHMHHHSIVSKYKKSYKDLLATAVKFAEFISCDYQGLWQDEADAFLNSPEVKVWKKGEP